MPEQSSAKALANVAATQAEGNESAGSPPRRPFLLLFGAITLPIILLDQATKLFVRSHMALYESIALIPNYLDITYTLNPGAAFSMLAGAPPWVRRAFLLSMSCAAIIVLAVLIVRSERVSTISVAFALVMGGAAGNLIDRAFRGGQVIDFMRAHYYDLNYPIFNVADSAISIGVALIILASLFGRDDESKPDHSIKR
ncbi:signal peptidase II [Candidatus Binatus sp.]|uniref:signal peptidase II n=1 Tax=Candidatus Binatus sp. TaxID=2811406 RepID=UPI003C57408B